MSISKPWWDDQPPATAREVLDRFAELLWENGGIPFSDPFEQRDVRDAIDKTLAEFEE